MLYLQTGDKLVVLTDSVIEFIWVMNVFDLTEPAIIPWSIHILLRYWHRGTNIRDYFFLYVVMKWFSILIDGVVYIKSNQIKFFIHITYYANLHCLKVRKANETLDALCKEIWRKTEDKIEWRLTVEKGIKTVFRCPEEKLDNGRKIIRVADHRCTSNTR